MSGACSPRAKRRKSWTIPMTAEQHVTKSGAPFGRRRPRTKPLPELSQLAELEIELIPHAHQSKGYDDEAGQHPADAKHLYLQQSEHHSSRRSPASCSRNYKAIQST